MKPRDTKDHKQLHLHPQAILQKVNSTYPLFILGPISRAASDVLEFMGWTLGGRGVSNPALSESSAALDQEELENMRRSSQSPAPRQPSGRSASSFIHPHDAQTCRLLSQG